MKIHVFHCFSMIVRGRAATCRVATGAHDAQTHVPACLSDHSMHRTTNLRAHSGPEVAGRRHVRKNITKSTIEIKQNYIYHSYRNMFKL